MSVSISNFLSSELVAPYLTPKVAVRISLYSCIETFNFIQVPLSTVTVVGWGDDPIRTSDEWSLRYNSSILRSCFLCVLGIVIIIFCINVYVIYFECRLLHLFICIIE